MNPAGPEPKLVVQPGPAPPQQTAAAPATLPLPPQPSTPEKVSLFRMMVRPSFLNTLSDQLFRLGFASIFLANSIYAAIEPGPFTQLLYDNPITNAIGFESIMVKIALVNDLLLGVLILFGWRKKFTYAWAGAWLLIVAGIKLMNLFTS